MASNPSISVTITSDDKSKRGIDTATANFEGFGSKVSGVMAGVGAAVGTFALQAGEQLITAAGDWVNMAKQAEVFGKKADTVFGSSSGDIKAWASLLPHEFGFDWVRVGHRVFSRIAELRSKLSVWSFQSSVFHAQPVTDVVRQERSPAPTDN